MDINNAFLQSKIDQPIYLKSIPGFPAPHGKVYKLKRSLYGLRQIPKLWANRLSGFILGLGLKRSSKDSCLFYSDSGILLGIYVDDITITGPVADILWIKEHLKDEFKCTDFGSCQESLGMRLLRSNDGSLLLNQEGFIQRLHSDFCGGKIQTCKTIHSPLPKGFDFDPTHSTLLDSKGSEDYRSLIGGLLWVSGMTRPDITFIISRLSQFVKSPYQLHYDAALKVLRYLVLTKTFGIAFKKQSNPTLHAFTDADWAGCSITGKYSSGSICFITGPICWRSKIQQEVSLSTTESEVVSLSEGCKDVMFLRELISEIEPNFINDPTVVHEDNHAAYEIARRPGTYTKLRHVRVRHFYCQDVVQNKFVDVQTISSEDQAADILTKTLSGTMFELKRNQVGVTCFQKHEINHDPTKISEPTQNTAFKSISADFKTATMIGFKPTPSKVDTPPRRHLDSRSRVSSRGKFKLAKSTKSKFNVAR